MEIESSRMQYETKARQFKEAGTQNTKTLGCRTWTQIRGLYGLFRALDDLTLDISAIASIPRVHIRERQLPARCMLVHVHVLLSKRQLSSVHKICRTTCVTYIHAYLHAQKLINS